MKQTEITLSDRLNYLKKLEQQQISDIKLSSKHINESLKPLNIVKYSLSNFKQEDNETEGSTLGLLAGFFTKKLIVGNSKNPIKEVIGNVVESIISKAAFSKHSKKAD